YLIKHPYIGMNDIPVFFKTKRVLNFSFLMKRENKGLSFCISIIKRSKPDKLFSSFFDQFNVFAVNDRGFGARVYFRRNIVNFKIYKIDDFLPSDRFHGLNQGFIRTQRFRTQTEWSLSWKGLLLRSRFFEQQYQRIQKCG